MFWFIPITLGIADQLLKLIFLENPYWQISYGRQVRLFFSLYENKDAAFSLPVPVSVVTAASVLILLALVGHFFKNLGRPAGQAIFFIIIGALSNLIDRFGRGAVTDYMGIGILNFRSSLFNLADLMILGGAVAWWYQKKKEP